MALTAILLPTDDVSNTGWTFGGSAPEATVWESINVDDTSTAYTVTTTANTYVCGLQNMPAALSVVSVTIRMSVVDDLVGGGQVRSFLDIGGTKYYGAWFTLTGTSYHTVDDVVTTGGAAWTPAQINSARIGMESGTPAIGGRHACSFLRATVAYVPAPPTVDVSRHIASVDLNLKKQAEAYATFRTNLDALAVPMLGAVDLEHTAGTHATGLGWEDEVWQRRPFAVHGLGIDMNTMSVTSRLKDQRPIRCLVRDLAWSDKASGGGGLADGIARFATPGAVFTFTRASEHTYTNPVGESEIALTDVAAYGDGGLYMLSASGGRAAPRYYVTNNSTARTLSAAQGSFQCEVNFAAVSSVANQTVAYAYHDADNWWWLYWDPVTATDRWVFEVRAAGTTYRAIKTATPSSSTWYQIGARWTGSNGENGDAPYTLSIFVDRVKGTDAVAVAAMTEASSSNFDFGSKAAAGTDQLNGQIRKIHSYQDVLTDTEMMRAI